MMTFEGNPTGYWADYTPVIDQGGTVTYTLSSARSSLNGKTRDVEAYLIVTGTGNVNTAVYVTLPSTPKVNGASVSGTPVRGTLCIRDVSAGLYYIGSCSILTNGALTYGLISGFGAVMGQALSGFSAALASGDEIFLSLSYEEA